MSALICQLQALIALKKANRPWHIPFMVAVAVGIPALMGAYLARMELAVPACMGAMVFLYIQPFPFRQRMRRLGYCALGLLACFTLGLFASVTSYTATLALFTVVFLATLVTRWHEMAPPGSFFFTLVVVVAVGQPFNLELFPQRVGLVALGAACSCLCALLYSLLPRAYPAVPVPFTSILPASNARPFALMLEASVIAFFVAASYAIALSLSMNNPYWVPISCAAIMQGATFRMVWQRKVHRVVGTVIGLFLASYLFGLSLTPWWIATLIIVLTFLIEFLVMRNYGLAVIFVTPLTILFVEATSSQWVPEVLLRARLLDIALGGSLGLLGGWVVYHPTVFGRIERWLMRVFYRQV